MSRTLLRDAQWERLKTEEDLETLLIDSTVVRAHQYWADAPKKEGPDTAVAIVYASRWSNPCLARSNRLVASSSARCWACRRSPASGAVVPTTC